MWGSSAGDRAGFVGCLSVVLALGLLAGSDARGAPGEVRVDAGSTAIGRFQRQAALRAEGETAYQAKRYRDAAELYRRAAAGAPGPEGDLYNEACAWALAGDADPAFAAVQAAAAGGLADVTLVESDADLASLKSDPRWPGTLAAVQGNRRRLRSPTSTNFSPGAGTPTRCVQRRGDDTPSRASHALDKRVLGTPWQSAADAYLAGRLGPESPPRGGRVPSHRRSLRGARCARCGCVVKPPDAEGGVRVAWICDPAGNVIGLWEFAPR